MPLGPLAVLLVPPLAVFSPAGVARGGVLGVKMVDFEVLLGALSKAFLGRLLRASLVYFPYPFAASFMFGRA